MTPPPWVQALYRAHHRYVDRALLGPPLTDDEALQRQRDYSLLAAWEWYDGGEGLTWWVRKVLGRQLLEEKR